MSIPFVNTLDALQYVVIQLVEEAKLQVFAEQTLILVIVYVVLL